MTKELIFESKDGKVYRFKERDEVYEPSRIKIQIKALEKGYIRQRR